MRALRHHLPPAPELTTATLHPPDEEDHRRRDRWSRTSAPCSCSCLSRSTASGCVAGVVEEKNNRVVELILSTVRPRHLLAGKVIGIGLLGLAQLALVAGLAATLLAAGVFDAPAGLGGSLALVIPWFALGFALYAVAYAAAGALASRQQNAETAGQPVTYTLLAAYFAGYIALNADMNGLVANVLTVFPLTAPLVLPARSALVGVPLWEHALAVVLVLASIYALVRFAGRVYGHGLLHSGPRLDPPHRLAPHPPAVGLPGSTATAAAHERLSSRSAIIPSMGHGVEGHSRPAVVDAATARQVAETMQALATPSRVRILAPAPRGRLHRERARGVGRDGGLGGVAPVAGASTSRARRRRAERPERRLRAPRLARRGPARPGGLPCRARAARARGASGASLVSVEDHEHGEHGHSHGLIDRSILRSREGVKTVAIALAVLAAAAGAQLFIFALSGSVALLADLIHNFGDALTAVPLGIAFFLRSARGEKIAGLFVVLAIGVLRDGGARRDDPPLHPPADLHHLVVLAAAGVIGFVGNELAAQVRLRGGHRLGSAALVADGNHARIDAFVSLGVIGSAIAAWLGAPIMDPVIGLAITLVILKITWDSWNTVRHAEIDIEHVHHDHDHVHEH